MIRRNDSMIIELDELDSESTTVYLKARAGRTTSSISIKDAKITIYAVYVNGKLKGHVEGKGSTIPFPVEITDDVGDVEIREIENNNTV